MIEYISPDEVDNMLVAYDIYKLVVEKDNFLMQFTHCDIPVLNLGLPSLTSPLASSNQTPRITFQTNQSKQTIGIATINPAFRRDKHTFYSYHNEVPLTYTIANKLVPPNGQTELVAIMSYGYNQEDSLVVNQTSMARFQFKTIEYSYFKITCEANEKFGFVQNSFKLQQQYTNLNYNKLAPNSYYPSKFTIISKDDVVVAKYVNDGGSLRNTSFVYNGFEDIVVDDITTGTTTDGYAFCKIRYYSKRYVSVGDKFSSRHGQKGVVSISLHHTMLPFTSSGSQPDKILSPLALPTRMTIGQLKEGLCGKLCAITGEFIDCTVFEEPNITEIGDKLESYGKDRWGREYMYSGLTGHWIDNPIAMTETYYQRLPKNAITEIFAASSDTRKSLITRQPLDGKANLGGLRFGEMEKDVSIATGAEYFTMEKMRDDSDGTYAYICGHCKKLMTVNKKKNKYKCNYCYEKKNPECYEVYMAWTALSLLRHVECSNIGVELTPEVPLLELQN